MIVKFDKDGFFLPAAPNIRVKKISNLLQNNVIEEIRRLIIKDIFIQH